MRSKDTNGFDGEGNRSTVQALVFGALKLTVAVLLVTVLSAGCATTAGSSFSSGNATAAPAGPDPDVFDGVGRSSSLALAINGAKMDAVRNFVIARIGAAAEQSNRAKLDEVLYGTNNANQFVLNDTMVTNRRENLGTIDNMDLVNEITIKVNRAAVENTLRAHGILAGEGTTSAAQSAAGPSEGPVSAERPRPSVEATDADWGEATDEEIGFIRRYVDTMTYMVYYDENTVLDEFLVKSAITQANGYLTSNGFTAIDANQVERIREEQQLAYESETGRDISIVQWIAQRLNADIYIEIDAAVDRSRTGANNYAVVQLTMNMFETSTGQLLGSVPYRSPRTLSRVSSDDAVTNAMLSSVYASMPIVVAQSRELMSRTFARGIRYEIIVQNSIDSRVMSNFRSRLRDRVTDMETVYQSAEETKYSVFFYGRVDDLEDLIYTVADLVPGLEGLNLVFIRGKAVTFDSGL